MPESELPLRTDPLARSEKPNPSATRRPPVPKRKKPGPYHVPPRAQRHGLLIVNTGDGKGKTTAAVGLLLRAVGRSMRVGMFQFMKASGITAGGEYAALKRLGVEVVALGAGCAQGIKGVSDDQTLAKTRWEQCRTLVAAGEFDVLVLDELTLPLASGWLDTAAVVDALRARPVGTHVVVTGRHAPAALIDAADLVTDMRLIKHLDREQGVRAQARDERRGLLIVHTGNGKGKTTAALGLLVRAKGYEMSVGMFQFIKSAETRYGEHVGAARLGVEIVPLGDGFTWLSENIADDRTLAEHGWARVRDVLLAGTYDVLILDELTYCLTFGWLNQEDVISALLSRPAGTYVIVTGRDAPAALIDAADLVTEMHLVKHPYREQGIGAQPGIEL
jgi:cob(I)alamin adenosyltransferase